MTLRLFFSSASPYVRKVMVCAHECGIVHLIEKLPSAASPTKRDPTVVQHNSSGKVPCLLLEDDTPIFDSRVITAYIDSLSTLGPSLYPQDERRFGVLTLEALADSILDAALLCRYEALVRPEEKRFEEWSRAQMEKIRSGVDDLESRWHDTLTSAFHAGAIAVACMLGYLDFRFADENWRATHPKLAYWFEEISKRPSMQNTRPSA